jgi:hypothetical protein
LGSGDPAAVLGFDDVANPQPERLLVRRRRVFAAVHLAKVDDRGQILPDAIAIQTLFEVRIESELVPLADVAID